MRPYSARRSRPPEWPSEVIAVCTNPTLGPSRPSGGLYVVRAEVPINRIVQVARSHCRYPTRDRFPGTPSAIGLTRQAWGTRRADRTTGHLQAIDMPTTTNRRRASWIRASLIASRDSRPRAGSDRPRKAAGPAFSRRPCGDGGLGRAGPFHRRALVLHPQSSEAFGFITAEPPLSCVARLAPPIAW
jgi:hypothetical protein